MFRVFFYLFPLSATGIFLCFLTKPATTRVFQHAYQSKMYPIHIEIADDWFDTKLTMPVSKPAARFIKNLVDYLPNGDARQWLEDSNLDISFRTDEWETTLHHIERIAGKKKPRWYLLRRWNVRPHVEIGPGAFKHDIVNLPPETLGEDMKKLVALQKRQETLAKDMNEGKENQ